MIKLKQKLEIREPSNADEFKVIEEIQKDAWGMNDIDVVPYRIIIAIHEAGGCVLIAYMQNEAIGFVLGFLGMGNDGKVYLHSHQLGVKRRYWGQGIGSLLKLKQREWAINRGINLIRWTFDPLLARNAHLNFSKLGVINNTYHVNLYGVMRDKLNYGMESDRFYVEWWINSNHVKRKIEKNERITFHFRDYMDNIANTVEFETGIPVIKDVNLELTDKLVIVEIPTNIEEVKKRDLSIAIDWRLKTREIFQNYFKKGYIAVDLLTSNENKIKRTFYILLKEKKQKILNEKWWELI